MSQFIAQIDLTKYHHPQRCAGRPTLPGTRFPISQVLAELADTDAPSCLASEYNLDPEAIKAVLNDIALQLDIPFTNES